MKKQLMVATSLTCSMLAGCASTPSTPYQADSNASTALNVMLAAGRTNKYGPIKDIPYEKYKQVNNSTHSSTADLHIGSAALAATGTTAPLPGMSAGGSTAFFLAGALLGGGGGQPQPPSYNMVIAWMPKDLANNKEDATAKLKKSLDKAISKAMSPEFTFSQVSGEVTGKGCNNDCKVIWYVEKPQIGSEPVWLGGNEEVYTWTSKSLFGGMANIHLDNISPLVEINSGVVDISKQRYYFKKISKYLPNWVYIYNGPKSSVYISGKGRIEAKGADYPVIYHQGQALHFVKPKSETTKAVAI